MTILEAGAYFVAQRELHSAAGKPSRFSKVAVCVLFVSLNEWCELARWPDNCLTIAVFEKECTGSIQLMHTGLRKSCTTSGVKKEASPGKAQVGACVAAPHLFHKAHGMKIRVRDKWISVYRNIVGLKFAEL
jgi:hypothetical protein